MGTSSIIVPRTYRNYSWSDSSRRSFPQQPRGAFIAGGVVTINDVGIFGQKLSQNAPPLFFNNFDSATLGASATTIESTTGSGLYLYQPTGNSAVPVVNDRAYSGAQSLSVSYAASGANFPQLGWQLPYTTRYLYMSFWTYHQISSLPCASHVWKHARSGCGQYYHSAPGTPYFYQTLAPGAATGEMNSGDMGYADGSLDGTAVTIIEESSTVTQYGPSLNEWTFLEYIYALPSPYGNTNGGCIMLSNGQGTFYPPFTNRNTGAAAVTGMTAVADASLLTSWAISVFDGFSFSSGDTNVYTLHADEFYMDAAIERVVLTDSPTYSSSTLFAMQPILTWNPFTITATLNTPGFVTGQTAYLHVFNLASLQSMTSGTVTEVANYEVVLP